MDAFTARLGVSEGRMVDAAGDVVFVPVKASAGLLDKILAGVAALYPLGVSVATLAALGL